MGKITTNCKINNISTSFQEIFKRIISPLYLLVLSLIACLIIIKSKDDYKYTKYKFGLFIFGVITIIVSEISINHKHVGNMDTGETTKIMELEF